MADLPGVLAGITGNLGETLGTTGVYVMYTAIVLVLLCIVGAILYSYFNLKSYNVSVIILRPRAGTSAFDQEVGSRGKHYYDKQKKEVRFSIHNGSKKGLQYNNEAIDQRFFVKKFFKGRASPVVYMAPNDQNWLQPVYMDLNAQGGLSATVTNADLSYYQTELELMEAMFGNKSFMERYYLLILVFLMIVVVCIQWYAAAQIHKAAELNWQQTQAWSEVMKAFAESMSENKTQVLKIG